MNRLPLIALLAGTVALAACSQRELILPGERLDPRAVLSPDGPAVEGQSVARGVALTLPAVRGNSEWTNVNGSPQHFAGNVAIGGGTTLVWANTIGQGDDRRHRITAEPIVAGGMVFTLDSRARVTATSTSGGTVWSTDTQPAGEVGDSVSGGGLAYEGGRVYATTGYGELVAIDARSGGIVWRHRFEASVSGAPTVSNGTIYVTARNAEAFAIRASDGRQLWTIGGTPAVAGVMGDSAPAVSGNTVVFPFSSGEMLGVDRATGAQLWAAQVAGTRTGRAIALLRDMGGDPVIVGNTVYAGTTSGRIAAVDLTTGITQWNARNGATNPVLPVGNAVFAVNDQSQLVRLDIANGAQVWKVDLPEFTTQKVKKQGPVYAHFGPTLAGSKLYVTSSDGSLRVFDPGSGNLIGQVEVPGGAATAPVVAGQTLYVVSRNGQLLAFR